ncbi:putative membrane protein [Pseudomonas syringae pv. syringae HS191]|nr:putative membrane protein [Pseudomonas syringae pv. syringae HS191]
MLAHMMEWLNLGVRWIHMIVGVAWIGASFYFVWLENNLNRSNPREGLSGDLWAIHGGGIYHLEKYKLAPPTMPENLHWFKWEAYSTWLSGVALLCVVFYANPTLYLLAPGSSLSGAEGVHIGLGSLFVGWFIYSFLCDSPLGKRPALLGVVLFVLLVAAAYGFSKVFSGRGAYLHVGAIMGTIMVGNVFRIIMPAQRALVAAIAENRTPDPSLPAKGLLRSRHNNYFTLPVLFIMISNHFPSTYGSEYNWLILAGIALLAVLVRHYFNTRHDSHRFAWTLPVAALGMLCLAYITGPAQAPAKIVYQVQTSTRCTTSSGNVARSVTRHAYQPAIQRRPGRRVFDTPVQIQQQAPRIKAQAITAPIMPLGNITQMTQQERVLVGAWIDQGAHIN